MLNDTNRKMVTSLIIVNNTRTKITHQQENIFCKYTYVITYVKWHQQENGNYFTKMKNNCMKIT